MVVICLMSLVSWLVLAEVEGEGIGGGTIGFGFVE